MINSEKIGKFIASEREKLNLTQEDLAQKLYVTRQAVSRWERGKALPSYDTLIQLCEIFKLTSNELIAGERSKKETSKEIENISLKVYLHSQKEIKRIIIISCIIFLILIISFLSYYFISTYNKLQIYIINGESEHFYIEDCLAIFSNEKAYIRFNSILNDNDYKITYVTTYYIKNGETKKIYSNETGESLVVQTKGYDEYFSFEDIDIMLDNLYIDITYIENDVSKTETISLITTNVYSNDNILFQKNKKISDNSQTNNENDKPLIPTKILKDFTLNNEENYELSYSSDKKEIKLVYIPEAYIFYIIENKENYTEVLTYYINAENGSTKYNLWISDQDKIIESNYNDETIECLTDNCKSHENIYNYYIKEYINKYF